MLGPCHIDRWIRKHADELKSILRVDAWDLLASLKASFGSLSSQAPISPVREAMGTDILIAQNHSLGIWGVIALIYMGGPSICFIRKGLQDVLECSLCQVDGLDIEVPWTNILIELQRPILIHGTPIQSIYVFANSRAGNAIMPGGGALAIRESGEDSWIPLSDWDKAAQSFLGTLLLYLTCSNARKKMVFPPQLHREKLARTKEPRCRRRLETYLESLCSMEYWDCGRGVYLSGDRDVPMAPTVGSGRHLTYRHRVWGHVKSQPCGINSLERKSIFVDPYVRGPEGTPIINRPRIAAMGRA